MLIITVQRDELKLTKKFILQSDLKIYTAKCKNMFSVFYNIKTFKILS